MGEAVQFLFAVHMNSLKSLPSYSESLPNSHISLIPSLVNKEKIDILLEIPSRLRNSHTMTVNSTPPGTETLHGSGPIATGGGTPETASTHCPDGSKGEEDSEKIHVEGPNGFSPIAIIGMGCRFAGDATSPSKLWELCMNGRSAWQRIPADRFDADAIYHPDSDRPGRVSIFPVEAVSSA